ncbi:hypothetical protein [Adhaeribacter radiodurans]|uniref:Uncharacterized protein n=1 Tax=Adhaeribacter radiodurans TaxID=2745197 RepID=A0A7L7L421_9BACT|nr:hypothetical protein [Adhaeribacter radiodurans]QMU27530.1 hypothetical protein HUW48_05520 [Adhaeribacter radiodurans]
MAGGPRLALSGWSKLVLFVPHHASFLGTRTLEGPQQPNWCYLFLATVVLAIGIIDLVKINGLL